MDMIDYIEREYNSGNIFINNIDKIIKGNALVSIYSLEELRLFKSKMLEKGYDINIYESDRRYPIHIYLICNPIVVDYKVIKMEIDYKVYSDDYYKDTLSIYREDIKLYKLKDILYVSI